MMERAVAEYLINAFWQVPLLAAGGWCVVRIVKPGPHLQHWLWVAVLSFAVLLPTHGFSRAGEPAQLLVRGAALTTTAANDRPASLDHRVLLPLAFLSSAHTVRVGASWVQWLVRVYLGTVIFALLRIVQAWRSAGLLASQARASSAHETALANFSRRFGIRAPQTRESTSIASPMIVGVIRPVLLLPEDFAQFASEEIRAALCHELAHIKRHDYLVNLGCQLAAVPLVWHPALHLIQQRIRMTREMACDTLAAHEMKSDIAYAKCLLSLAHSMFGVGGMAGQNGAIGLFGGWFTKSTLEERIMQLTERTTMSVQARAARMAAGAAVMSASLVLAATFHLAPMMPSTSDPIAQTAETPPMEAPAPAVVEPEQSPLSSKNEPAIPRYRVHREYRALHAEEKAQLKQQIDAAQQQAAAADAFLHSQAFQEQMEDAKRQALDAKARVFDSEQFKQQMQDAQRQSAKAAEFVHSPAFQKQMEDAKKQASQARAMLDTPEFRQQMEEAKRQALDATDRLNNPEFRQKMDDMQRKMGDMQRKMGDMMKDFHPQIIPPAAHP